MHIEAMEAGITTELQRSEFLRQSILKRAFSGQLVPQDPNDEPASRLLERIRAEKVAQASKQKPTKRTGKKRVTA
jgi:type I restriction enzyme S subunit